MADKKPASFYYRNFGGVNLKSSAYELALTEFTDLKNVDFEVPGALQKRPGSTQAITTGTSGPITSVYEFSRLDGQSWIITGSDTALFYIAANDLTLLDTGWTNGQPQDIVTFVNKSWIASGQNYKWWDGGVSYGIRNVGLPCPKTSLDLDYALSNGNSLFLVGGYTMFTRGGNSFSICGIYVAYSYIRDDGYYGPIDFLSNAKNTVVRDNVASNGDEYFGVTVNKTYFGVSWPTNQGISAIAVWVATDTANFASERDYDIGSGNLGATWNGSIAGDLGWVVPSGGSIRYYMSITLKQNANLTSFRLYTTIPTSNLFTGPVTYSLYGSSIGWGFTFVPNTPGTPSGYSFGYWASFNNNNLLPFSGTPFCWFETNTPKYIDTNQNVMFMSGFSNAPSTIWFSEVGQPEFIDPEYNFEVRTNDGDRIIGHRTYNGNVIIFKTTSFHKLIGTNPDTFQLIELSLEFGAVSNQAIVEYNEKLLWLDRKGIIQYDGANWRTISDKISPVFGRMNLDAAYEKAVAVHNTYRNQVWFGIPVDGSTENNLTIVWDYLVDAFTFFDGFDPASFSFIKSDLSRPTIWYGDYSGMVYYTGSSFYGDNGRAISCVAFSRFEQFKGENATNVWRRLFLDVTSASGITGVMTGSAYTDYNQSTVMATFTMYQTAFQSKAEMGVVGKAVAFEVSHHSASLPFLMNGYTWAKRYLRNV